MPPDADARWELCRRPRVMVGGELTMDLLDLQFNPALGFYTAPIQMKANNGILIIDDFGREKIKPGGIAQSLDCAHGSQNRFPDPRRREASLKSPST